MGGEASKGLPVRGGHKRTKFSSCPGPPFVPASKQGVGRGGEGGRSEKGEEGKERVKAGGKGWDL